MTTCRQPSHIILIEHINDEAPATRVRLHSRAEVYVLDGHLDVRDKLREVRVGPLTAEQAELLAEDLEYLWLENDPELVKERREMRKGKAGVAAGRD